MPAPASDAPSPLPDAAPTTGVTSTETGGRGQPNPPTEVKPEPTEFKVSVGGGMILFAQLPFANPPGGDAEPFFEVFEARLRLDAEFGRWGMHIAPIFRDTPERSFFPGTAWVQEAYAYGKWEPVTVKVGKIWAQFGRFWDNSFYGNVQEYDGLKLDPDVGVSVEAKLGENERMGAQVFVQYFLIDGVTNYSIGNRDTVGQDGRQRNYIVGRVEPFMKVGDMTTLKLGLSGSFFQADFDEGMPGDEPESVGRIAVDATAMVENFTGWAEYTHQFGNHLAMNPFGAGAPYDKADWFMVGGEYTYDRYTLRLTYNMGFYSPIDHKESILLPGFAVAIDEHLFVLLEYALEQQHQDDETLAAEQQSQPDDPRQDLMT